MSIVTAAHKHTNRLINETSPYLLQHAHNPVDWYRWGTEAFERAAKEDRPIFLSIGYSTCHWCHVMEHESFEDEDIARIMNEHFVSIKVDREHRPDVDQIYLQTYQITGKERYGRTARDVFDYVLRDMTDPAGGFYSAEDADSEGEEGTFYVWDPGQIEDVLDKDQAKLFNAHYGVTKRGNFEKGKTILNVTASIEQLAKKFETDHATIEDMLSAARRRLFARRAERVRPHRDDKVITAWNGLMISSLAYGGTVLDEEKYTQAAERSAEFILNTLHKNDRLMRYYRDGRVIGKAFLDDYAFMILGLLDLYEATFDARWLIEAKKLAAEMIELFADSEQGGFFLAGKDSEKLIARTKPGSDGAVPSGNSIAAMALLKLGRLTMSQDFSEQGSRVLEAFSAQLDRSPAYSSAMLGALSFSLGPGSEIIIAGGSDAADTKQMLKLIGSKFLPNAVVLLHDHRKADSSLYEVVPFLKSQTAIEGKATAYVCENYACKKPVNSAGELENLLAAIAVKSRASGPTDDE
ncbi:MAG: thioredoxin domain-containing protein [Phycisphaerae bacterium]|nr:thioredoxin domain-containing protein [Phycisphaerae bacterium]